MTARMSARCPEPTCPSISPTSACEGIPATFAHGVKEVLNLAASMGKPPLEIHSTEASFLLYFLAIPPDWRGPEP